MHPRKAFPTEHLRNEKTRCAAFFKLSTIANLRSKRGHMNDVERRCLSAGFPCRNTSYSVGKPNIAEPANFSI